MEILENYGVQALDVKEMKETDGGVAFVIAVCALYLACTVLQSAQRGKGGYPY